MLKCGKIPRKVKTGQKDAMEAGIDAMTMTIDGWTLRGEWWTKLVPVVQIYETEHKDNLPPDVGTPDIDDLLLAVENAVEKEGVDCAILAKAFNTGMYQAANAKAKPQGATSVAGMEKIFVTLALKDSSGKMFAAFGTAVAAGEKETFLRQWMEEYRKTLASPEAETEAEAA